MDCQDSDMRILKSLQIPTRANHPLRQFSRPKRINQVALFFTNQTEVGPK